MSDPVLGTVIRFWLAEIERRDPTQWIPQRYREDLLTSFLEKLSESDGQMERLLSEFDDVSRLLITRGLFEMAIGVSLDGDMLAGINILGVAQDVIQATFLGDLVAVRLEAHRLFLVSWIAHCGGLPRFQTYGIAAARYAESDPGVALTVLADWIFGLVAIDLGDGDGSRTGLNVADRFDDCYERLRAAGRAELSDELESARRQAEREAAAAEALLTDAQAESSVRAGAMAVTARLATIVRTRIAEAVENPAQIRQIIQWAFLLDAIRSTLGDDQSAIREIEGELYQARNWMILDSLLAAELERTPDDESILERQLASFHSQRRDEDQVRVLEELTRRLPQRADLFSQLGFEYYRLGRPAEGRRCLERALQIDPNDPFAQQLVGRTDTARAQVRFTGDRIEFAEEENTRGEPNGLIQVTLAGDDLPGAVLLNPGGRANRSPGQDEFDRAEEHFGRHEFAEAESSYRAALDADPNLLLAYVGMGDVHYAAGRYHTAAAYFEEACLIGSYAPAYRFLGDCLNRIGDRAAAIACYRKAVIIDPSYGMARRGLADLLARQRQSETMQGAAAVRPTIGEPRSTAQIGEQIAALARRERVRPDLSKLVAGTVDRAPIIADILAAGSLAERERLVRANLQPAQYPGLFLMLQALAFHYTRLEGRAQESLELSQLGLRVIEMLPESWKPQESDDANRAGLLADAYLLVSRARLRVGEPQQALADALRADAWIVRSEEERKRAGIASRPRIDRIFGLTGSRRAEIQQAIAQIYRVLGDESGLREYERQAAGITGEEEQAPEADINPERRHALIEEIIAADQFTLNKELGNRINEVTTMNVARSLVSVAAVLNHLSLHRSALSYMYRSLELNVHQGAVDRTCHDNISIGNILLKRPDLGDAINAFETALKLASVQRAGGGVFDWGDSSGVDWHVHDGESAFAAAEALAAALAAAGRRDEAHQFIQLSLALSEATRATIATESYRIKYQTRRTVAYQVAVELYVGMAADAGDPGPLIRRAFQQAERARGRTFLDVMGTIPFPPPDEVPAALLERERDYLAHLERWRLSESVDLAEYERLRSALEAVWREMAAYPAARRYLALREGQPILFDELRALLETG